MKRSLVFWILVAAFAVGAGPSLTSCGATDNGGGDGDTDSDSDSDSDADGTTIYDIRQGEVAEDTAVSLEGVVVTTPIYVKDDGSGNAYIQEADGGPWSGMVLYIYSTAMAELTLARGDVIDVTGLYQEYYGLSELVVQAAADVEVTASGQEVAPEVVAPADVIAGAADAEAYESVLVRVEDVVCTDPDIGYGEFEVTGGLPIDDWFFETGGGPSGYNVLPVEGDTFDAIVGPLAYTSFDDEPEYKIAPRDLDDYVGYTGAIESEPEEVTIEQIQTGEVVPGAGVILTGVVVTSPLTASGEGFFVQDPDGVEYAGIHVFNYNGDTDPADIAPGDVVTITGTYDEFADCSEVSIGASTAVEVTDSGATIPDPIVIEDPADIATDGADTDRYEGMLVQVSDVTVTVAINEYDEFEVTGGLMVGSIFFDSALDPDVDTVYATITAPLHRIYEAILEPRTLDDLVE